MNMYYLFTIAFIVWLAFMLITKLLIYRSKKRTDELIIGLGAERYEQIKYQQIKKEIRDRMELKEKIISITNDIIKRYEKDFHALPCRIIEKTRNQMSWRIEKLSEIKTEEEMVNHLLESLVFQKIGQLIEEDTKEYDDLLKKKLLENKD